MLEVHAIDSRRPLWANRMRDGRSSGSICIGAGRCWCGWPRPDSGCRTRNKRSTTTSEGWPAPTPSGMTCPLWSPAPAWPTSWP